MKNNIAVFGIVFLMMACLVSAAVVRENYSFRANDGAINYIGGDNVFSWTDSSFSANARVTIDETIDYFGSASISLRGTNEDGQRVSIALSLKPTDVRVYNDGRIYVDNEATGTFYRQGNLPVRVSLDSVRFDINRDTGLINVAGGEGTPYSFRVTGMVGYFLI